MVRVEAELKARLSLIEAQQTNILSKMAHDPVEAKTFEAVSKATDDRVTLLQNSINDINRQIAAVVFGIDNGIPRKPLAPPPP